MCLTVARLFRHTTHGISRDNNLGNSQGRIVTYLAIGGGSVVWVTAPSHSNGKCLISPGFIISSTASSAPKSTARCPSESPGFPICCPNGYSIPTRRGTLTAAVKSGIFDKVTVVIPAFSISLCANPTDQQQIGQAGIKTTTSTFSARRWSIIPETLFSSNSCGLRR